MSDMAPLPPDAAWLAIFAHEMRSPLAAILGYQELLEEGTFGTISPAAADAAARTRAAALQLLALADGLDRVASEPADFDEPAADTPLADLVDAAFDVVRADAAARDVLIETGAVSGSVRTRRGEAVRALALALSAAVKVSTGARLLITAGDTGAGPRILVEGTLLDPARDDARSLAEAALSGAGLRLFLARCTARAAAAGIRLSGAPPATAVALQFHTSNAIDGAEDLP